MRTRADWHAKPPARPLTERTTTNAIVVHWPGVKAACQTWTDAVVAQWLRNAQAADFAEGQRDLEYSLVVDGRGELWEGRGLAYAHGANGRAADVDPALTNEVTVSVCVLVGIDEKPNSAQLVALARLRDDLRLALVTHQHARKGTTQCPGPDLIAWVEQFSTPTPTHVTPSPPPPTPKGTPMIIVHGDGTNGPPNGWQGDPTVLVELVAGTKRHVSADEWTVVSAAGVVAAAVPQAALDALPWQ